eukprot:420533_1
MSPQNFSFAKSSAYNQYHQYTLSYFRISPRNVVTQHFNNASCARIVTVAFICISLMTISFNYWHLQPPKIQSSNATRSKSESAVILIAGSVAINGSYISRRKQIFEHNKHPTSDLQGTISDATNMYKLFLQSKGTINMRWIESYVNKITVTQEQIS